MKSLENQLRTKTSLPPINAPNKFWILIDWQNIIRPRIPPKEVHGIEDDVYLSI